MDRSSVPSFLAIIQQALRLNPDVYVAVGIAPGGIWIALTVVLLAGLSESAGQSMVLFLNRVRPARFGLAVTIATLRHIAGYVLWTITIWLAASFLFDRHEPVLAVASVVGLAYAPQIFSFFELTPYLGNAISVLLSLWSMLAIVIAVRAGFGLATLQAVTLAGLGWLIVQLVYRTVGRPLIRIQRWLENRAAGVPLAVSRRDVSSLRRHPIRTWYTQLESWRQRRWRPASDEKPPIGGQPHG